MTLSNLNKAIEYLSIRLALLLGLSVFLFLCAAFIFFLGPYIVILVAALLIFAGITAILFALLLMIVKSLMNKAIERT